jgi:hypothetical protein
MISPFLVPNFRWTQMVKYGQQNVPSKHPWSLQFSLFWAFVSVSSSFMAVLMQLHQLSLYIR